MDKFGNSPCCSNSLQLLDEFRRAILIGNRAGKADVRGAKVGLEGFDRGLAANINLRLPAR